eukprot:snap_masked-scaffold_83-processed-gene-0.14-mRNA-1 protein AED:0.45 eAED:0.45 QI:0/-1/0/1/-1/1/1/0/75
MPSLTEVAKHKSSDDCWIVISGQAYNVTEFLDEHPGGKKAILMYAGKDATAEFEMLHKPEILTKYAKEFLIGKIE